jgi:hypothetical protein
MDPPPAEGNFCDKSDRPVKPNIMEWYNQRMGYVNNSDHMVNSYSMSQRTLKWTTKLFFNFLDLTVLNSWILLSSCGAKYTHRDLRSFWWGIWLRKLERAKIAPPPDWLEGQVQAQKSFATWESPLQALASKIFNPTPLLSVFFSRPRKGHHL